MRKAKKITKDERLVQDQMLAMLEWASVRPDKWHKIGNLEATKKAAELLAKHGVIEVWREIRALPDQSEVLTNATFPTGQEITAAARRRDSSPAPEARRVAGCARRAGWSPPSRHRQNRTRNLQPFGLDLEGDRGRPGSFNR
jgi:hypothetical protein